MALFNLHCNSLSQSLSSLSVILTLALLLYSVYCVNETTLDEIESIDGSLDEKKATLINALREAVSTDYKKLAMLFQKLSEIKETKSLSEKLRKDYGKPGNDLRYLVVFCCY